MPEDMSLEAARAEARRIAEEDARMSAPRPAYVDKWQRADAYFVEQVAEFCSALAARLNGVVPPEPVCSLKWISVPQPRIWRGFNRYGQAPKDVALPTELHSGWSF